MTECVTTILEKVKKLPGLYLNRPSIYALAQFIIAYELACIDFGHCDISNEPSFLRWLEHKYKISYPAWTWARILHHIAGSEKKAITLFYKERSEFMQARNNKTTNDDHVRYGAPISSITNSFWEFWGEQEWPVV